MKRKIISLFSCMLIFINILALPATAATSLQLSLFYDADNKDVRTMTYTEALYATTTNYTGLIIPESIETRTFGGFVLLYSNSYLVKIYCNPETESLTFDTSTKRFYTTGDGSGSLQHVLSLHDYHVYNQSYFFNASSEFNSEFRFGDLLDNYTILYSDYDIYVDDELYRDSDNEDPSKTNSDWFSVTCNPRLSENMSFSTTYTNPQGNDVIASYYTLDVTVTKTGQLFEEDQAERLVNYFSQCFVFISTEPVSDRNYSAALNSSIYLHYENRQYYADVVNDPDYDAQEELDNAVRGNSKLGIEMDTVRMLKSYSLVTGYVPYDTFYTSKTADFSIDLNGVPLEAGKTYYLNVIAMPVSSVALGRSKGISRDYPITSLSVERIDGGLTNTLYGPSDYINNCNDLSRSWITCKSISFSLSDLDGYNFVDKSDEFGLDPYEYADDKLQPDKYPGTVSSRTDYNRKLNSYEESTGSDNNNPSLSTLTSGAAKDYLIGSMKEVIPFFTDVINTLPSNISPVVWLMILIPLVLIVIAIVIGGLKFVISLFS